ACRDAARRRRGDRRRAFRHQSGPPGGLCARSRLHPAGIAATSGGGKGMSASPHQADIVVERDPPHARLYVNRPEVRNALSFDLVGRLTDAFRTLDADKEIRVILLSGRGDRAFISGADVTEFHERLTTAAGALEF